MQFDENQLAGLLQATRDFARQALETMGGLSPFGGRVRLDGELEFFALPPAEGMDTPEAIYREVEAVLRKSAAQGEILAGLAIADIVPPAGSNTAFANGIGILLETADFARFFCATYRLSPPVPPAGTGTVELGEIIPVDVSPTIFAG